MVETDLGVHDLGPLAWVLDELRKSLDGATKALKRFMWEADAARGSDLAALDASQLRIARQQLHQAVGALEMVGIPGVSPVLRAMEAAVQKYVLHPEQCSHDAVAKIEYASFAATEYLERLLAGKPVSAVSLFPQYRDIQELLRADRIHPADLWSFEWRWIDLPLSTAAPRSYGNEARSVLDHAVLQLMKGRAPQAAHTLSELSLGFSAAQTDKRTRIFWALAAAYFEAFGHDLLGADLYVRRAASRILLQYASLAKGDTSVSERLAQDLLFFCAHLVAHETVDTPTLSAVRLAYDLTRFTHVNYELVQFGRFDPALLAQARKRIISAKETWSSLCAGDSGKLKQVTDQFSLVTDSLLKLHPASEPLASALSRAIDTTVRAAQTPRIELAMEVATSVLYLEAVFDDLDPNDPQLAARTGNLAQRLEAVRAGGEPQPLEVWMEELYRHVSDKQTMGSVVGELRLSLGDLEKALDTFFRSPQDKTTLQTVPGKLQQMRGVLSVLGLEQASKAVVYMISCVEQMLDTEIDEQLVHAAGTFEHLGNNLGALSFLIDMLNYQPALAKKLFIYDEEKGELKPLMGRAQGVASAVPSAFADNSGLAQELGVVIQDAAVAEPDQALGSRLDALATHAELAEQPALARNARDAALAVSGSDAEATASAFTVLASSLAAQPAVLAEETPALTVASQAGDFEEDDLQDIFLEEAREVVGQALQAIDDLAAEPEDEAQLTVLRRAFHTLKGSSRMVGLNEFGEAAWALEQMLNSWLADQKAAMHDFRALVSEVIAEFSRWISDIEANQHAAWSAEPFRRSAEAMRTESRYCALGLSGGAAEVLLPATAPAAAETFTTQPLSPIVETDQDAALEFVTAEESAALEFVDVEEGAALEFLLVEEDAVLEFVAVEDGAALEFVAVESGAALEFIAFEESLPEAELLLVAEIPQDAEIDFSGLFSEEPSAVVPELPVTVQESSAVDLDAIDFDSLFEFSSSDSVEAALPEIPVESLSPDIVPETGAAEVVEMSAEDFAQHFQAPQDELTAEITAELPVDLPAPAIPESIDLTPVSYSFSVPHEIVVTNSQEAEGHTPAEGLSLDDNDDEKIKVIGDLRIGIPLYNVYLNEADEWSRRLVTEVAEWALEGHQPVSSSTVALAHSLAGSSATVGFSALSDMARALEHALEKSRDHHSHGASDYGQVFVDASEDIRRLLHQFAAGFLKQPEADIIERLKQLEFSDSVSPEWAESGAHDLTADADPVELTATPAYDRKDDLILDDVFQIEAEEMALDVPLDSPGLAVFAPVPVSSPVSLLPADLAPTSPVVRIFSGDVEEEDLDVIDAVDAVDPDLFPIFEEECAELLPQLGGALRQWSSRPDNKGARLEVLRVLHTLKGSARLTGAMRLGEMAHRIESEIEFFGSDNAANQEFEPLLARFDRMQSAFERLRLADTEALAAPLEIQPVMMPEVQPQPVSVPEPESAALQVAESAALEVMAPVPEGDAPARRVAVPAPQAMAMQALRQASTASIRVRSQLLDRMVNQAGEVMITRSRLEAEVGQLRGALNDMSGSLNRLRHQLRDIEVQAESQMQSRLAQAKEAQAGFDPLEFDRFTRVQELTRMMAESVNDVATVQRTLQRTVEATEDDLIAQARQTRDLQRDLLRTRMVEFEGISDRLYRVVRLASKESGKQVRLDLLGGMIEMDRGMLDRLTPAFEHLLRNCVAHGIESPQTRMTAGKDPIGLITVHLRQEGNDVAVDFSDDGSGLDLSRLREKALSLGLITADQSVNDQEAADLVFLPGLSTASEVTELAGRGIGMDVVRAEVNALGGRIETSTERGKGTHFTLVLPLTTAVTQVVMIRAGQLSVGVPANVVETVRRITAKELHQAYNTGVYEFGGEAIPFFWSGALLQSSKFSGEAQTKTTPVVVFRSAAQRIAMHVDEVLGNREVVVKNLGPQLSRLPGLAGMSVLPSGAVVLIYNPVALASIYGEQARSLSADKAEPHVLEQSGNADAASTLVAPASQIPLIMVVDDSITVRRVTQRLLLREGYRVVMAADGLQALERLQDELPAVVLSDIEMPRMDGFDLARNIRADARLKGLPIVMITSRIAEKHRDHAKSLGVDHYLGKPYSEDELIGLVRHYCAEKALAPA